MSTGPLMLIYKPNISPFTKNHQLKANFYKNPFYVKVPSLLLNKLAQVFTSRKFMYVASMKSKVDGGIGPMDICDEHGIPEELIYNNLEEESMPGAMTQRILRKFYMIGKSNDSYTQQQNKLEGHIRDL